MQAIILTAGQSSRFWPLNQKHKTLLKIMGKPLICYTIESLKKAGVDDLVIVQGPQKDIEEELKQYDFGGMHLRYVVQPETKGMGNAIFQARKLLQDQFFVLNAERFDSNNYIEPILTKYKSSGVKLILLGAETPTPWLFGILEIEGDRAKNLIEKPENQ